mmetsp:Transcript_64486/g.207696  ORF Transcript_64486/g.207696 Transcript_64486/m.207696 type:complete len:228 (-) Transcript_64486:113-796(-)
MTALRGPICQPDRRCPDECAVLDGHLPAARQAQLEGFIELVRAAPHDLEVGAEATEAASVGKGLHGGKHRPGAPCLHVQKVASELCKPRMGAARSAIGRRTQVELHVQLWTGCGRRKASIPLKEVHKVVEAATSQHQLHQSCLPWGIAREGCICEQLAEGLRVQCRALLAPLVKEGPAVLWPRAPPRGPNQRMSSRGRLTCPRRVMDHLQSALADASHDGLPAERRP